MSLESFNLLNRLIQIRKNKKKIEKWKFSSLNKIGFSSYTFYKLTNFLEKEGVINSQDKSINWQKLDELIKTLQKKIIEDLEPYDFDYDPSYEKDVSYELKKKE